MDIDVRHVAKLAKLRIEEENIDSFSQEMEAILQMVENLPPLDTSGGLLEPDNVMELREDEIVASYPREQILKNAPETANGCFVVPQTVD